MKLNDISIDDSEILEYSEIHTKRERQFDMATAESNEDVVISRMSNLENMAQGKEENSRGSNRDKI